jgi:serine/threonine-protein kinase
MRASADLATLPDAEALHAGPIRLGTGCRFVLREVIGTGGACIVIAAHDPQLDRTVAVKLLRPELGPACRACWTERLAREAQAMARLAHPNVVPVYEIIDLGEQIAIVMELVDGVNLREWIALHTDWREVIDVITAAGRGLAAAHAVGLIHRDVKPDNVLVGRDGRARVADFGLVTSGACSEARSASTRRILGTPAYMAPEQRTGGVVDGRTDQFAFCITAWEALFHERPRRDDAEPATSRPRATGVPRCIEAALRRGLSRCPDDRWPSMTELLAALEPPRRRRPAPVADTWSAS